MKRCTQLLQSQVSPRPCSLNPIPFYFSDHYFVFLSLRRYQYLSISRSLITT